MTGLWFQTGLSFSEVNTNSISHTTLQDDPMWKPGLSLPQLLVTQFQEEVFTIQEAFIVLDVTILHKKDQKAV